MKKFIALAVAVVMAASFSVVAFAKSSPSGQTKHKVTVTSNKGGSSSSNYKMTKNNDGTITLTAVKGKYDFLHWQISGRYEIVSGSLKSGKIVIRPLSDLKVKQIFDVKGNGGKPNDGSGKSPKTGENGVTALGLTLVLALAGVAISKKQLVK